MRDLIAGEVLNILRSDETDALGLPDDVAGTLATPQGDSRDAESGGRVRWRRGTSSREYEA